MAFLSKMRLSNTRLLILPVTALLVLLPISFWLLNIDFFSILILPIKAPSQSQSSLSTVNSADNTNISLKAAETSVSGPKDPDVKTFASSPTNPPWASNILKPVHQINREFNTARDSRNYALTTGQCDAAFPGLFFEIDRAVEYQKAKGQITAGDIDLSWKEFEAVKALIIDQQVSSLGPRYQVSI